MKYLVTFICTITLIFSLSACSGDFTDIEETPPYAAAPSSPAQSVAGSNSENTSPEAAESESAFPLTQTLRDIIPSLDDAAKVSVKVPGFAPNHISDGTETLSIFAQASDAQARTILNYIEPLRSVEFAEAEEYEHDSFYFSTSAILIENTHGSCTFFVTASAADNGNLYITVIPNQKPADIMAVDEILPLRYYEGRPGAFPIRDLNDALTDVLLEVNASHWYQTLDSDEPKQLLNKYITAVWRYMFDAAVRMNGPAESPDNQSYDLEIAIDDTTYLLDRTSGYFSKNYGGDTILGKLSEDTLEWFLFKYQMTP